MTDTMITVVNQLDFTLVVYDTMSQPIGDPPSTNPADYYPVYKQLGTVAPGQSAQIPSAEILPRLVMTRQSDDFPVQLFVPDLVHENFSTTVTSADLASTNAAWAFYQSYVSQPYAPLALQFSELVTDPANILTLDQQVCALLSTSPYEGANYDAFNIVSFWASNSLHAWSGTYYCYEPTTNGGQLVLPQTTVGTLLIQDGSATFTDDLGAKTTLTLYNQQLASSGASKTSGLITTGTLRDLSWEGKPDQLAMCWSGTHNGNMFIAQPYQQPTIPWWVAAYDMAFIAFEGVQIAMTVDMAAHVLQGAASGLKWLGQNAQKLYQNVSQRLQSVGENANPLGDAGDPVDPINVDVDVDVDVDIDIDVDVDVDVDIDVDIDIDIDIDVLVVDIDVDIDIDIDTDNVVDNVDVTDTDVDVDIDTDVNVEPGMVQGLVNKVGNWIMTKGFPALVENLTIMVAFQTAGQLLNAWKSASEQYLASLAPQQSTGVGLLVNSMLNEANSVQTRWTTFAQYVKEAEPDNTTQQMNIATVLMTANAAADQAQQAWRWSIDDENALVAQMAACASADQAYILLGGYTYKGQGLPIKVGCSVALKYLNRVAS